MSKLSTAAFQAAMEVAQSTQASKLRDPEYKLFGQSSDKMKALMNLLGSKAKNYIEFGVGYGSTLISTMFGNPHLKATAIENYYYDEREPKRFNENGWENMKIMFNANITKYINGSDKMILKSNLNFIEKDLKSINYVALPKHDLCLFDIQPFREEELNHFFTQAIKSLHLDAVVIFTGMSDGMNAYNLNKYIKKYIKIEKEYTCISNSTFDNNQFYSGIRAIKMKSYICKQTVSTDDKKKRNKSN